MKDGLALTGAVLAIGGTLMWFLSGFLHTYPAALVTGLGFNILIIAVAAAFAEPR